MTEDQVKNIVRQTLDELGVELTQDSNKTKPLTYEEALKLCLGDKVRLVDDPKTVLTIKSLYDFVEYTDGIKHQKVRIGCQPPHNSGMMYFKLNELAKY